jgi:hypothetical protein
MPSSTSSSRPRGRRSHRSDLVWFAATFLAVAGPTAAWWVRRPVPTNGIPAVAPRPDDYFTVSFGASRSSHLDHVVLYHGAYDTPRHLRAADVLVLGNSRVMMGLAPDELRALFEHHGLSYYMLGFGHGENDRFPLDIVRRFDLRPRYVVVNADHFFLNQYSPYGQQVARLSRFEGRKTLFEETAHFAVNTQLRRLLPQWNNPVTWSACVYRSRGDGTWHGPTAFPTATPIPDTADAPAPPVPPPYLEAARRFKAEVESRGAQLVLTFVPSGMGRRDEAEQFARHLDVPLVSPRVSGLATFDGSHLTAESARRFTAAFAAELEPLLGPPSGPGPAGAFADRPW